MEIGFIGAGNMADAMIAALLSSGIASAGEIHASDADDARRADMAARHGIRMYAANTAVAQHCRLVVLVVKPQILDAVLAGIRPDVTPEHLFLSIAAGRTLAWLEERLGAARVIRVMPNVACLVAEGMSVLAPGARADAADVATAARILGAAGRVLTLPEAQFDAVTAVSGSGPAFFALFAQALARAGATAGLAPEHALFLAGQTMLGTARLLAERGLTPEALMKSVTSPGGTTAAGLAAAEAAGLSSIVARMVAAAAARSRELSGEPRP